MRGEAAAFQRSPAPKARCYDNFHRNVSRGGGVSSRSHEIRGWVPHVGSVAQAWRVARVALSYAAFGVAALGLAATVVPAIHLFTRGRSLVVFPEGTRSPDGGLAPVQRSAAHIARQAGCDLLPVTIRCEPPTLKKGQPWWDVPETPFEISLEVGSPVRTKEIVEDEPTRGRVARAPIREYFEQRVGHV